MTPTPKKPTNWGRFSKTLSFWILVILIPVALLSYGNGREPQTAEIDYSAYRQQLAAGNIKTATFTENVLNGQFNQEVRVGNRPTKRFTVRLVNGSAPKEQEDLYKAGVKTAAAEPRANFGSLLITMLPYLLLIGFWIFLFRQMQAGGNKAFSFGKSKAKLLSGDTPKVTFADVAGADEAKVELQEIVSFLKDKDKYGRLGARIPKGILLVGPPGTGKTLMARAVAGEARVPFFSISGSEFVEMFVGVGAARVRDLFEQARRAAPCIIFIDELDALGRARTPFGGYGGGDEKEQTLNQLLSELDGFDPRVGIVLLAATNRPEILDPALTRAGRFDRQVVLDRPDRKGREAILRVHIKAVRTAPELDIGEIAGITPGFTGADLANLVNEAAIFATRRHANTVTMADFTEAVERIIAGAERRGRLLRPEERERVAYHEMGHALAAASLLKTDPVHKVSIIPRSIGALGYTMQRPTDDHFLITASELKERMVVLLAGRAAEEVIYDEISTGAADDLVKASEIARQCVTRFGMSVMLGPAVLEEEKQQWLGDGGRYQPKDFSEATAREVDLAVREMLEEAGSAARDLLRSRIDDLRAGARMLVERETITPEEFPPLRRRGQNDTAAPTTAHAAIVPEGF